MKQFDMVIDGHEVSFARMRTGRWEYMILAPARDRIWERGVNGCSVDAIKAARKDVRNFENLPW